MQDFLSVPPPAMAAIPTAGELAPPLSLPVGPSVISPADLGLPALPPPPQVPQAAAAPQPSALQRILRAMPGIVGAGLGPGTGTGLLQGTVLGQQRNEELDRLRQQDAVRQFQLEQQSYDRAAQRHDVEMRQREDMLQQSLSALRNQVKTVRTAREYDEYINAYATGLRGHGFRIDANWLRSAAPFTPPSVQDQAGALFDQLVKTPINAETLKKNPEAVLNGKIDFDLNGDGIPERVSVAELGLKGNRLLQDANGAPIFLSENTPVSGTAFDQARQNGLRIFRETNRREPTAEEDRELLQEALDLSRVDNDSEFSAYVKRLEAERGRPLSAREYRAERQRFRDSGNASPALIQGQARSALKAAMLAGKIPPGIVAQLRAANLDPQVEIAAVRQDFISMGRQFSLDPALSTPDELFELGRRALQGSVEPSMTPGASTSSIDPGAALQNLQSEFPQYAPPTTQDKLDRVRAAFPNRPDTRPATGTLQPGKTYRWTPNGVVLVR